MTADLPTPDVLRARIEAERDAAARSAAVWDAVAGHDDDAEEVAYAGSWVAHFALLAARHESALARLDRHGGGHDCVEQEPSGALFRWFSGGDPCDDYRDLASEYPAV